jgi:hypothetical protein
MNGNLIAAMFFFSLSLFLFMVAPGVVELIENSYIGEK